MKKFITVCALCVFGLAASAFGYTINSGETKNPTETGSGAITVLDGGTFNINQNINNTYSPITITGTGNGGIGAMNVTGNTWRVDGNVVVDTSAAVQTDTRIDLYGTLTGGTLTKTGANYFVMHSDVSGLDKIILTAGTYVAQSVNAINTKNGVQVNGGTLQIWDTAGVKGTNITMSAGSLQSAGSDKNTFLGTVTLTGTVTFNCEKNLSIAGAVTGGQTVNKAGVGTWNIANSVTVGRLNLEVGTVNVVTGGTLNGADLYFRDAQGTSATTYTTTLNINGGNVVFSGTNTRMGHWPNHVGVINLNSGSYTSGTTNVGWDGAGKFIQTGGTSTFTTLNFRRSGSVLEVSAGTMKADTFNIAQDPYGNGTATGNATFKGTASAEFGTINTYGSNTLYVQDSASVHVTGNATMGQKAGSYTAKISQSGTSTVTIDGYLGLGNWTSTTGIYEISGGTLNVLNYDASDAITGLWMATNGNGQLDQSGGTVNAGRINLNARDADYTGTINLTGGTLNIGAGGIIATEAGNGRYAINFGGGTVGALNVNWTSELKATLTGTNGDTVFAAPDGKFIFWNGILSGSGGLVVDGAGTLVLKNTSNSYSGGTVVNSKLELYGSNTGGSTVGLGDLVIEDGGNVICKSDNVLGHTVDANIPKVVINEGGTLTPGAYLHVSQLELNSGTIVVGSSTGGSGLFFGRDAAVPSKITSTGTSAIAAKTTLSEPVEFAVTSGELTVSGLITGGSVLTKTGAGKLTLSSANTYGATTISGGTLALSGAGTLGTGLVSVQSGMLDLVGKTDGAGTVNSLTLGGLEMGADGVLRVELYKDADGTFFSPDPLTITNNALLDGTLLLYLQGEGLTYEDTAKAASLLTVGGTASGSFASILVDPTGNQLLPDMKFLYNPLTGNVEFGLPEPSTWALLLLSVLGLTFVRRRPGNVRS